MKTYIVNGKVYRSRNKEILARRLFTTINRWGEKVVVDMPGKRKMMRKVKGEK